MKRYILFAGDDYYPLQGCEDIQSMHETIEEAIKAHDPKWRYDGGWANIWDNVTQEKVWAFFRGEIYD